ncbi:MAG: SpoIID/LytB domain-containing protein [Candidatus Eremiobacteraeota bacterium]|nr:SpoIID/LytB domain-containing protein [Candidatus Eremiobacteraeota bacterium]
MELIKKVNLRILSAIIIIIFMLVPGQGIAGEISPHLRILLYHSRLPIKINTYRGAILVMGPDRFQKAPLSGNMDLTIIRDEQWLVVKDGKEEIARLIGDHIYFYPSRPESFLEFRGRLYRGGLEVREYNNELLLINHIELERYLKGVLPMEMGRVHPEALKAQAVAARSYALGHRKNDKPYDLTADQSSQVYGGASVENYHCNRAIKETTGQVLAYNGELAGHAMYFSCCGGRTARIEDTFDFDPVPYLTGVNCSYSGDSKKAPTGGVKKGGNFSAMNLPLPPPPEDAFCSGAPLFRWEITWNKSELESILASYIPPGDFSGKLNDIRVIERSSSGRVKKLLIISEGGDTVIRGDRIRKILRFHSGGRIKRLYSTLFEIKRNGDKYIASGRGWGHGVGMCQWGAFRMAEMGEGYRNILSHYYPGCQVVNYTSLPEKD